MRNKVSDVLEKITIGFEKFPREVKTPSHYFSSMFPRFLSAESQLSGLGLVVIGTTDVSAFILTLIFKQLSQYHCMLVQPMIIFARSLNEEALQLKTTQIGIYLVAWKKIIHIQSQRILITVNQPKLLMTKLMKMVVSYCNCY